MDRDVVDRLIDRWLALWNGDLAQLDLIIDEALVIHAVPPGKMREERSVGRAVLGGWIRQLHECFEERTRYEIAPIIDGDRFVVRWHSTGRYRGGMPGVAPAAEGRAIDFKGIDIARIANGRIVEFWMSLDGTALLDQLGAEG